MRMRYTRACARIRDKLRQRKQERSHGRPAGLHQGGQSSRLGCWRAVRRHGNFKSSEAEVPEGGSDVTTSESPDELTLRAEDVNTLKAYIDVNPR